VNKVNKILGKTGSGKNRSFYPTIFYQKIFTKDIKNANREAWVCYIKKLQNKRVGVQTTKG
jgi:hypothetical protein